MAAALSHQSQGWACHERRPRRRSATSIASGDVEAAAPWVRAGLSNPNQDLKRERESVKDGSGPMSRMRGMFSVLLLTSLSLTGVMKDGAAAAGRSLPSPGLGDGEAGTRPGPAATSGLVASKLVARPLEP